MNTGSMLLATVTPGGRTLAAHQWINRRLSTPKAMKRHTLLAPAGCLGIAMMLSTQTALSQTEDETIIELSPFMVSADDEYGYRATNSTSGTRLSVPIRDLPLPVEVVTSEFIQDIGATDLESALAYSSGVYFDVFETKGSIETNDAGAMQERSGSARSASGAGFNNSAFIRGFRIDTQTREGFRLGGSIPSQGISLGGITDTAMMQRIEVVKGPAALLYGVGVLSGVVNVIGKRPLSEAAYQAEIKVGSDDLFRASFDATGPLAGGVLYRLGAVYHQDGDWTDYWNDEKQVYYGQLEKVFFDKKLRTFVEGSMASQLTKGVGFKTVTDDFGGRSLAATGRPAQVWNRGFHIPHREKFQNRWDDPIDWVLDEDFGNQPASFRMSGPDTYRDRDEWGVLADVEFEPVETLIFKVGTYQTGQDMDTVQPRATTFTNRVYNSSNMRLFDGFLNPSLLYIIDNPESPLATLDAGTSGLYGNRLLNSAYVDDDDYKTVGYFWTGNPITTRTSQIRAEATYSLETTALLGKAKHTFLAGFSSINDTVTFPTGAYSGWVTGEEILKDLQDNQRDVIPNFTDHPFRNPTDITPIRYKGEKIASIARNLSETEVFMDGAYFVYMGNFFDERLMVVSGLRKDSYNVRESVYSIDFFDFSSYNLPVVGKSEKENYTGSGSRLGFVTKIRDGSTDPSDRVPIDKEYHFDKDIENTSPTMALSYKVNDALSVFGLTSGGFLPNTGWKDGNDEAIPPEITRSYELGVKFELLDKKLSGSISAFRINRENGVMAFTYAPRPYEWSGNSDTVAVPSFSPEGVITGQYPISYGVRKDYLPTDTYQLVIQRDANGNPLRDENGRIIRSYYNGIFGVDYVQAYVAPGVENIHPEVRDGFLNAFTQTRWSNNEVGPYFADMVKLGQTTYQALTVPPIWYLQPSTSPALGQNPTSINSSTNVTFEDKSTGLDLNLVYTPLSDKRLQFVLNYSHVEREITGLQFVDPVHKPSGERFFTPYDGWVWYLGAEAFDANGDPLTFNGKGVYGKSLYFAPEDSAKLWMKYTFNEGAMKNLSVGGGVSYTGPAATSVILGNPEFDANRFLTPNTEERYQVDLMLSYFKRFEKSSMRVALNVFNLLDSTHGFVEVAYPDVDLDGVDITRYRKSENYYAPRAFQLSVSWFF